LSLRWWTLRPAENFTIVWRIGVGDYFQDCLFSDIDSLVLYAGIHRQVFGFHRLLSKRFPYAIYYRVQGDIVLVFRVLDCRRDPQQLRESLGNE
jgi:hypothetical protein